MNRRQLVTTTAGAFFTAIAGCAETLPTGDTESTAGGSDGPDLPADRALSISESIPVEGTMVKLGAKGTAKNTSSTPLTGCVIHASGVVGDSRYGGVALRDRLEPDATWKWQIFFGEQADASNSDAVKDLVVATQAEYLD